MTTMNEIESKIGRISTLTYDKNLWPKIKNALNNISEKNPPNWKKEDRFRQALAFTMSENEKDGCHPWRWEEALERFITLLNPEMCNQFPLKAGSKEDIDLVFNKTELIELKQWKTKNSRLYALIEVLKNYYILKKQNSKDLNPKNIKTLTVLAPEDYYNNFSNKDSYSKLSKLIEDIEQDLKISIKVQSINIERDAFNELCQKLSQGKTGKLDLEKKEEEVKKADKNNITEALKKEKWKDYKPQN